MSSADRFDSWKEIAAYLKRGVRTAQRWEVEAGLPVHRVSTERGAVFAYRSELDGWWRRQSSAMPSPAEGADLSVAVLPFATLSDDPQDEYIGYGLADEIVNALAYLPNVRVVARSSSFACYEHTQDVRAIGIRLGVARVVLGCVRRSGDEVRVTTQVLDAADGRCVWSGSHDGNARDLFDVRHQVARGVLGGLRAGTTPAVWPAIPKPAAYDAYLKARYHSLRPTPSGAMRVRSFLGEALTLDPDFALAHANLAVYFFTLVVIGLLRSEDGMPAARVSAQRALDLDPALPDARALAAAMRGLYDYEWADAERLFDAELLREPVASSVRYLYAIWHLSPLRRHAEALVQLQHGLADDPFNLLAHVHVAMELQSLGRENDAHATLESVLEIDPEFGPALGFLGREHAVNGRVEQALACAERTYAVLPKHPNAVGFLAGMLRRTGASDRSRELLQTLDHEKACGVARARAESHLVCGEVDAAAGWIANAIADKDPGVWLLLTGTMGKIVQSSSHWAGLAARLKLPIARQARPSGH